MTTRLGWWRTSTAKAVAAAFLVAAFLIAVAGVVVARTDAEPKSFWEDAVSALLTAAGGVVITGAVGVAVNRFRDREVQAREHAAQLEMEARENAAFVEAQVIKLWDIHEQVKRSAVLIAAHQSARTYGEELRTIIGIRTALSDVQGVVERRRRELAHVDFDAFTSEISTALFFLNPLIDEFSHHYKDISARQSVDEARNKRSFNNGDWENRSSEAWSALNDPSTFSQLHKLIAFGQLTADQYRADANDWAQADLTLEFLDPISLAAQLLRVTGPEREAQLQAWIKEHEQPPTAHPAPE